METTQGLQGTKIALLIDFDNVILGVDDPGFDVELVVNALRSRGIVVMGRAYGDWYRHHRHRRKLMEQGIELVETPVFGPLIKNSADIRIVLDGFEIAMSQAHIDTFCLVSGDSDFLPLIKKLQYLGKTVIVIAGNKFTSDLVRRNCNEYISYENLLAESVGATEDVSVLEGAFALLERAINTLNERGMDVRSSTVKQMMLQLNPAFSEHTFGYNQFKQFLDRAARANIVKLGSRVGSSGEYAVLLPNEVDEGVTIIEPPRESAAPAPSRGRRSPSRETSARETNGRVERREPRDAKARTARGNGSARPAETAAGANGVEDAALANTGASDVTEAPSPTQPDVSVPLEATGDTAEYGLLPGALSGRVNLRRGRLRFSAKSGRSTLTPQAGSASAPAANEAASPSETSGSSTDADPALAIPTDALSTDAVAVEQATTAGDEGMATAGMGEPIETPEIVGTAGGTETHGLFEAAPASEVPVQGEVQSPDDGQLELVADTSTSQSLEVPLTDAGAPASTTSEDKPVDEATSNDDAPPAEPAPVKKRATRSRRRKSAAPQSTAAQSGDAVDNEAASETEQPTVTESSDAATSPDAGADGAAETGEAATGATGARKKSTRSRRGGTRRNTSRATAETPPAENAGE